MGIEAVLLNAIGPIVGGFLALLGAFVVYYLTNKANERRFQKQLNHEDRKESLRKLHDLLESKADEPYNWANKITGFDMGGKARANCNDVLVLEQIGNGLIRDCAFARFR